MDKVASIIHRNNKTYDRCSTRSSSASAYTLYVVSFVFGVTANIMPFKTFAISLFIFAFVFWCWALKNTIRMEPPLFDWGLVSFGSVLMTTSYLLALANLGKKPMSNLTRILAMSSHVLVALNYLLGAYLGFKFLARPGFVWYCAIFTVLWLCIAGIGSRLLDDSGRSASGGSSENQGLMS